jgi:hypothetical protein
MTTPPAPHLYSKKIYPLNRMNNNQNNGTTIILLLIVLMISSSMSSVGAVLGFNLFTSVGASRETKTYLNEKDRRVESLAVQAGVDEDELRGIVEQELETSCIVYVDKSGKCPDGMKVAANGCCEFKDIKNKLDLKTLIGEIAFAIVVSVVLETLLVAGVQLGRTYVSKTAARKFAAKVSAKMARKLATGIATRLYIKFQVASKCPGVCGAAILGFELMSLLLDLSNALGYDNFIENKVVRQTRNISEVQFEETLNEDGSAPPMPFSPLVAFPEYQEEMRQHLIGEFLPDAFSLMSEESMVKFLVATMDDNTQLSEQIEKEFEQAIEVAMKNTDKRDKLIYDFYVKKGKGREIEKIPFLSSENIVGVALTQGAAQKYNDRMKEKHLLYANPFRPAPDEIPKDYSPFVASYTDTYRVLDRQNPGTKDNPNVIEKKLPKKVCLLKPWGALVAFCEYGIRADNVMKSQSAQRLNPKVYGVQFNTERGDCDFTNDYCKRLGLKLKNNECTTRPGQKEAEFLLGETATRSYMRDWDNRIEAWNSGDAGSVALATVSVLGWVVTPWINEATGAIKDTYGRGAGTPMICGPDKERKGELCYPKCRTGPNGEEIYKSSALECEGACPTGTRNTGFTCLQPIHAYIPGNKCSNPFKACFYQRQDCRDGYTFRGTTCNEECRPGFTFRSGAAGSAFCDKPRNRYSRAGNATVPDQCPEGKKKDAALCYKPCKPGYRGQGPTCKKSEESERKNPYLV